MGNELNYRAHVKFCRGKNQGTSVMSATKHGRVRMDLKKEAQEDTLHMQ